MQICKPKEKDQEIKTYDQSHRFVTWTHKKHTLTNAVFVEGQAVGSALKIVAEKQTDKKAS